MGFMGGAACSPPPPARTPVQMTPIEGAPSAQAVCQCDEPSAEDEPALFEDEAAPPKKSVAYVRMTEWQPPESVQRIESEIVPRGEDPPRYIQFPQLKLHRGIGESRVRTVPKYWR